MTDYHFDFGSGMPLPPPRIKPEPSSSGADTSLGGQFNSIPSSKTRPPPVAGQSSTQPDFACLGKPLYSSLSDDYGLELYYHRHSSNLPHRRCFRSLSDAADTRLLDYLQSRHISPAFLQDIDFFLDSHPEIAEYKPEWTRRMNSAPPLDAYLHFVKGWLRPARYLDAYLPHPTNIPLLLFDDTPLAEKYDQELVDFFGRYRYRDDVLKRIDREVYELVWTLWTGPRFKRPPTYPDRQLVVLALYGNLVDVYKFYEYCYQTEWMPHRKIGEHNILREIASFAERPEPVRNPHIYPVSAHSSQPTPRQISYPGEDCQEDRRAHKPTRVRMARANDVGMNVINVLLEDFTAVLWRRGFRGSSLVTMRTQAIRDIDHQRATLGGLDIVDLVMKRAYAAPLPAQLASIRNSVRNHATRNTGIHELVKKVRVLREQEANGPFNVECTSRTLVKRRRSADAQLVKELTTLLHHGGKISSHEAEYWQRMFKLKETKSRESMGIDADPLKIFGKWLSKV